MFVSITHVDLVVFDETVCIGLGYYDDGDPIYVCDKCKAYMWFGERLGKPSARKAVFSVCCGQGKVVLPLLKSPPKTLLALLYNDDDRRANFRDHIRSYNMMFSFTSLGGNINYSINNGGGPYLFQLCGENFHNIGSILPCPGERPAFLQLYIHDTTHETMNKIAAFG